LTHNGKEISPDEFSQLLLEGIFFKVDELSSGRSHDIGGEHSWMAR